MSDLTEQQVAAWLAAKAAKLKADTGAQYACVLADASQHSTGPATVEWQTLVKGSDTIRAATLEEAISKQLFASAPHHRARTYRAQAAELLARASALEGAVVPDSSNPQEEAATP